MVIDPVSPAIPPEAGALPSLRTLPFRPNSNFFEILRGASTGREISARQTPDHMVRSGESLWSICEDALKADGDKPLNSAIHAAVQRIAASNRLKDPNVLAIGQRLDMTGLRQDGTMGKSLWVGGAAHRGLPANVERVLNAQMTEPATILPQDAHTTTPPLAALPRRFGNPVGGGLPVQRPLFHRLSNARPPVRAHAGAPLSEPVEAAQSVDLAALMQSILNPGSIPSETPAPIGPWSKVLGAPGRFSSGFGMRPDPFSGKKQFHEGIDIAATAGTSIYPYMPGIVKAAGWDAGHGNHVVIEHPNGMETLYAHASETLVKAGEVVLKNTPIAKVGSTGHSTGPHLHFEVRQDDKLVNPLPLFQQNSLNVAKAL